MKKALLPMLIITLAFVCTLLGIFIGRNLMPNYISVSNNILPTMPFSAQTMQQQDTASQTGDAAGARININSADAELLSILPGIGEVLAERIIEYRNENGPFSTPEDLLLVEGIGETRLNELIDYITVGG